MTDNQISKWAEARLGTLAGELPYKIGTAVKAAHDFALKAHLSAEMDQNDAYGHALKVKMHQTLEEALENTPGVILRKPSGGRFSLPIIAETSVALLPIRYSTDRQISREKAKINLSDFRRSLLALVGPNRANGQQLSIEDAMDQDLDVDAHYEQMAELDEQLRSFGQVVTIGFGSNPTAGLWGVGWGDLRVDEDKQVAVWEFWEELPEETVPSALAPRTPLGVISAPNEPTYFDQTDEPDTLDLFLRHPRLEERHIDESGLSESEGEASNS